MEKKRSKGVTFWAWVFILLNVWILFWQILSHSKMIREYGAVYLFQEGLAVSYLVAGIGLLQVEEWARRTVVYSGIITIFLMPTIFGPVLNDLINSKENGIVFPILYSWMAVNLLYVIATILFFMNLKVKEQFNQKGS